MKNIDLQEIRSQLDEIDAQMVALFEKRMELCRDVAEFKIQTGKPVYDYEREKQKIAAVTDIAHGAFNRQAAGELFTQIMTISRRLQYQLLSKNNQQTETSFTCVQELPYHHPKVVYQGVEGAYSHEATLRCFGSDADACCVPSWEDAMKAVRDKEADYAVLPIENSSAGAVIDNYDLLIKYHNYIVEEVFLPVNHALLGLPGAELSDISTVYSHPQALAQCQEYLAAHPQWKQVGTDNTATSAKQVSQGQDKSQAAIASEVAGGIYGLLPLQTSINYNKDNITRFIVLSRDPIYRKDAGKVSICFELPHESGTLYNMLSNFIYNQVNMIMIESRPIRGKNWEYRFFVDIEGNLNDSAVINALKGIDAEAANMRILGNY